MKDAAWTSRDPTGFRPHGFRAVMTAMSFPAPAAPGPFDDEREQLLAFVAWQREQVVATTDGLTEADVRWTPDGKLLPILAIVNHLTKMEWRWINGRYLGEPFPPRTQEFPLDDDDLTLGVALDRYEARAEETASVVRAAPSLDEALLGREGDGPLLHELVGATKPFSLRYAVIHLVEETAHHAGHADATREMLDGRKMRA